MAENKTQETSASVEEFIEGIDDESRRADSRALLDLMSRATGQPPRMWGDSIVGFGSYHYRYESGREGDWFKVGFSPRKQNLTVYLMDGFDGYREMLDRLGRPKTGKSCLYLKRLDDVDIEVLQQMVARSYQQPSPGQIDVD